MTANTPLDMSHLGYATDALGNELDPIEPERPASGFTQSAGSGLLRNTDLVSLPEGYPGSNLRLGEQSINPKVPIPRAKHFFNSTSTGRVSRACVNCHELKAKCSGHRPSCHRCQEAGIPCSYADRKHEKIRKQLDDASAQINTYETLIRKLYPRLDEASRQLVDQTLGYRLLTTGGNRSSYSHLQVPSAPHDKDLSQYPLVTTDYTAEDFNRSGKVQAMGFIGDHSEVTWLYKLKRFLDHHDNCPILTCESPDQRSDSISSLNYFQDDAQLSKLDNVDLSQRPPWHIADQLVKTYFQAVHHAFPIIGKNIFLLQFRSFYEDPDARPRTRWVAVLNLVFAIASKFQLLVTNKDEGHSDDHHTYFARAWRLSMQDVALIDHPNLQQVQVEGLTAFYLLSNFQVNRSWRITGIAVRSAVAMGLNLRNAAETVTKISKETRYRVWWALCMLDTVLCVRTGRPPSTEAAFCTTPLPIPYPEEDFGLQEIVQIIDNLSIRNSLVNSLLPGTIDGSGETVDGTNEPWTNQSPIMETVSRKGKEPGKTQWDIKKNITPNISLSFLYGLHLDCLLRRVLVSLYAPGETRWSWVEKESTMSGLNNNAENWLSRLPEEFNFTKLDATDPFIRQRADLAFRFYTTKIAISQPCLRRIAYETSATNPPSTFCSNMALICVQMACKMLDLLPSTPDAAWLYGISPWWCVLHYVMQSMTVILTQLIVCTEPGSPDATTLISKIGKALRWLREISIKDPNSGRAWLVCMQILSRQGEKFAFEFDTEL
ncbi:hypothetical protein N7462_003363 [Penicillium macrosclerotiorum]|uniref:uncharacterized protein n=1 Tax=Penicillium macrosclerotiorum TaxID=303699 RepID=UPI0025484487|nr:uncharacterized protein N7462_003363 [Penicillium macrosclerotiorum]KAJ5688971.1 hypothetical protein N7462_003363 [Penicillium macrosclerotiorum]